MQGDGADGGRRGRRQISAAGGGRGAVPARCPANHTDSQIQKVLQSDRASKRSPEAVGFHQVAQLCRRAGKCQAQAAAIRQQAAVGSQPLQVRSPPPLPWPIQAPGTPGTCPPDSHPSMNSMQSMQVTHLSMQCTQSMQCTHSMPTTCPPLPTCVHDEASDDEGAVKAQPLHGAPHLPQRLPAVGVGLALPGLQPWCRGAGVQPVAERHDGDGDDQRKRRATQEQTNTTKKLLKRRWAECTAKSKATPPNHRAVAAVAAALLTDSPRQRSRSACSPCRIQSPRWPAG